MWQANKIVIIFIAICIIALGVSYQQLVASDPKLAEKVLVTGLCAMLFIGGLLSLYLSKKDTDSDFNSESDSDADSDSDTNSDNNSDTDSYSKK